MQQHKTPAGRRNLCGHNIARLRMKSTPKCSQRALADQLQLIGIDITKNAVQRIESGERCVTDMELKAFADVFQVSVDELLAE